MDIVELINKKKDGKILTEEEIQFFVDGVCSGTFKDYQTSSFLMAIFLKGLNFDEIYNLTISMANSGDVLDLSDIGVCLDKHSTGGVSDSTTLIVVPILASLGVKVAKMSGHSLGWTGGTADKMAVFDGYNLEISTEQFKKLIAQNNASIISQSDNFALADKILYKLRSETGTVDSLGLIASSIMSKKIACGAKIVLLDVKYGNGAFMKTKADAIKLAKVMVKIGKRAGQKVCAVISNMNQPLTKYIGNNLEVYSAIRVLEGEENNLSKLSYYLSTKALLLSGRCKNESEAQILIKDEIQSKRAFNKLCEIVNAQGGIVECLKNPKILLPKNNCLKVKAESSGFVKSIDTALLGYIEKLMQYTANKFVKQNDCGIILNKEIGDYVEKDEILFSIYFNELDNMKEIQKKLGEVYKLGKVKIKQKLIEGVIE